MSNRSLAANVRPASGPFGAPGTRTGGPATKGLVTGGSADLDQLQRLAARSLDHHRARVAEAIGPVEKSHALAAQLGDPGVEVRDAQRDVIVELAARARERGVVLPHV